MTRSSRHIILSSHLQLILTTLLLIGPLNTEAIPSLENVRVIPRSKDLLLLPHPLRVVDAVNVILRLKNDAAVLGDRAREVLVVVDTLGGLERHGAVLEAAAVHLEGVLVGVDVDFDAGPLG